MLLVLAWLHVRALPPVAGIPAVTWWMLGPAFCAAELAIVRLELPSGALAFSLWELPLVVGLFAARPGEVLAAALIAALFVSAYNRREPPVSLLSGSLTRALEAAVALSVFGWFQAQDPASLRGSAAAGASVLAATAAATLVRALASRVAYGELPGALRAALPAALASLIKASVALIGLGFVRAYPASAWLLLPPAAAAVLGYRAYAGQVRERERVSRLHEAAQALQVAGDVEAAITTLLRQARSMFRATFAEIQLAPEEGEVLIATLAMGSDAPAFARVTPDDSRSVVDQLARPARIVDAPFARGELERRFRRRGLRSVMLAPLAREGASGLLLAGNPERPLPRFEPAALGLFAAFAAQAGAALEKDRLQDKLRHLAFHDPLTNLANRALFADRANQAIQRARRHDARPAVLLLDLDDFKIVNDSLGHAAGDSLLLAVAGRLRACIRPHDTGARLGGDEFAILLEDAHSAEEATRVAQRLTAELSRPFEVEGREILAPASIGIALAEAGGSVEQLLRQADVAMYHAKGAGKSRWLLYESSMRRAAPAQPTVATANA